MRTKIRIAMTVLLVIIIIVCILIRSALKNSDSNKNLNINNETIITNEYVVKYKGDWEMLINYFLRGLIDYNEMPLSKKFRNKYSNVSSIVPGNIFGILENNALNNTNEELKNCIIIHTKTGKGSEDIAYKLHYTINENNELDDIEIIDSRVLIDENGNYPKYVFYHYYYDEPDIVTAMLCYPYVTVNNDKEYYRIYVTDNFLKKFPDYLTIGVTGDTDYIMFGDSYCDKDNKNTCYAEFLGLEWTKTYKLTYEIDDKGYINDIDIELYEKKKTEDPEYVKNYYQEYLDNVDN